MLEGTIFGFSLCLALCYYYLRERSLCTCLAFWVLQLLLKGHSDCLALVANEAYVHGSHRVRTEKQYLTSDSPRTQLRGSKQKYPPHTFPLKEVYLYTLQAAAWGSSLQSACIDVLSEILPCRTLPDLGIPSTTGSTKNKEGCLVNHKDLRDYQEVATLNGSVGRGTQNHKWKRTNNNQQHRVIT